MLGGGGKQHWDILKKEKKMTDFSPIQIMPVSDSRLVSLHQQVRATLLGILILSIIVTTGPD